MNQYTPSPRSARPARPGQRTKRPKFLPSLEALENRLVPTGVISGHVFQDVTGNGLTADDAALSGVTVKLYADSNHNGVLDYSDQQSGTRYSGADGSFSFSRAAGTYFVKESVPSGWVRTGPTLDTYYTVTLADGQTAAGNDFDNYQKPWRCVIDDISFTLTHADGTQSVVTDLRGNTHEGDTVTANFTIADWAGPTVVSLVAYHAPAATFDANTAGEQTIASDSHTFGSGQHSLSVVIPAGFYQVDFVLGQSIDHFGPAGSNIFYTPQGRLLSADNGGSAIVPPPVVGTASLSGVVFEDMDGTGVPGGVNVGLAGSVVTLTGVSDTGQQVTMTYSTLADGIYSFTGIPAGTYTITVTPSDPNLHIEPPTAGSAGGTPALDGTSVISGIRLDAGTQGAGYNFGESSPTN